MFGRGISLFTLAGFEVKLDWSWVFIALLIAWSLAHGYFPAVYEGLPAIAYWGMGLAGLAGLAISIVLHELAHSLVARRYGLRISSITLFVFGGIAQMEDEPSRPKAEFMMAIAGPVASLLIALAFYLMLVVAYLTGASEIVTGVLRYLVFLNVVLALFNIVPAFPLDGGRVLRSGLWWWLGDIRRATRWAARSGVVLSAALMALGIISVLSGAFLQGIWWVLIAMFIYGAAQSSETQLAVRQALRGEPVERFMTPSPITVTPDISVRELVDDYIYRHHHSLFPVTDGDRLVGCVSARDVKSVEREDWQRRSVRDILSACAPDNTIDAGDDAMEAFGRMQRNGRGRLMVTRGDRLVGILALSDLMKLLSLRLDLEGRG